MASHLVVAADDGVRADRHHAGSGCRRSGPASAPCQRFHRAPHRQHGRLQNIQLVDFASDIQAMAQASALRLDLSGASSSRLASVSFFESRRPSSARAGSRITAAANTGPASGPRPASSTPQMIRPSENQAGHQTSRDRCFSRSTFDYAQHGGCALRRAIAQQAVMHLGETLTAANDAARRCCRILRSLQIGGIQGSSTRDAPGYSACRSIWQCYCSRSSTCSDDLQLSRTAEMIRFGMAPPTKSDRPYSVGSVNMGRLLAKCRGYQSVTKHKASFSIGTKQASPKAKKNAAHKRSSSRFLQRPLLLTLFGSHHNNWQSSCYLVPRSVSCLLTTPRFLAG